jgi:ribosome maturation factor RimP
MAGRDRTGRQAPARGRGQAGTARNDHPTPDRPAPDRARLRAVIAPIVEAGGYDLEELAVSRAGRRQVVRVVVDGDEGVNLDTVADLSREVSAALDADEQVGGAVIPGEYVLEVSSPGVDRPLTEPRHWRRNIGRLVNVPVDGARLVGRISAADSERVTLEVDGVRQDVGYARLGAGRIQIEFGPPGEDWEPEEVDPDEVEEDEE